jgi:drug/metabolite transporter (DMT)-like permease
MTTTARPDQHAGGTQMLAYGLLVATGLLWAGNAVAGKFAVGHISPFLLTTLRWVVALALLLVISRTHLRRDLPAIRANWRFLFLMGALGFTCFNAMFYLALNYTSAINVAIEQSSMPLMVFLLNFLFFGIRVTLMQVLGFLITVVGVAITATHGNLLAIASTEINFGDALMIFAIMLYGAYSVGLARRPPMHLLSFLTALSLAAFVSSLPFAAWEIAANRVIWPDMQGWLVTLFTALGPAILAQLFWARGLEIIGSNRGGIFINIVPVFAAVLAVVLLGERFHAYHAAAIALVFAGVTLSQRKG